MLIEDSTIDKVWTSIGQNFTPDGPLLRYGGPIKVFLHQNFYEWVGLNNFMKSLGPGISSGVDWETIEHTAFTRGEFYSHVEDPDDQSRCKGVITRGNKKGLTKKKIRGRLLRVSLRTLRGLDRYFTNSCSSSRTIHNIHSFNEKDIPAYVWVHTDKYFENNREKLTLSPTVKVMRDGKTISAYSLT